MKLWLLAGLLLLSVSSVLADPPFQTSDLASEWQVVYPKQHAYLFGENITQTFHVYTQNGTKVNGSTAKCIYHLYGDNGRHIFQKNISISGVEYEVNISSSILNKTGTYEFLAMCEDTSIGGFASGGFEVTATGLPWAESEDLTPVAVIVLLPFLLALITIVGSVTLDPEEHPALKIGLFLFSYLPFYVSLWWGAEAIGRWYDFPGMTNAIANGTFFGIIFFILLVFYVVAYFIWKAIEAAAEKNAKRLTY